MNLAELQKLVLDAVMNSTLRNPRVEAQPWEKTRDWHLADLEGNPDAEERTRIGERSAVVLNCVLTEKVLQRFLPSQMVAIDYTFNAASRIESAAEPNAIFISLRVRDSLELENWPAAGNSELKDIGLVLFFRLASRQPKQDVSYGREIERRNGRTLVYSQKLDAA